jgi:hypothetical protein
MSSTVSHHSVVRDSTAREVGLNNFNIIILRDAMPCGVLVIKRRVRKVTVHHV